MFLVVLYCLEPFSELLTLFLLVATRFKKYGPIFRFEPEIRFGFEILGRAGGGDSPNRLQKAPALTWFVDIFATGIGFNPGFLARVVEHPSRCCISRSREK